MDIGCSPFTVSFILTLTSSSSIDSVVWDLGDGTAVNQNGNDSTNMVENHNYTTSGNFIQIVRVFDKNGCE